MNKNKEWKKYDSGVSGYVMKRGDKNLISMIKGLRRMIRLVRGVIK